MATPATSSRPSPSHRQTPSRSSPTPNSIARGATARSAVSPKVNASLNGVARRPSLRSSPPRGSVSPEMDKTTRESLLAALKRETEEKEELLVRVQNKDQSFQELSAENNNLTSALNAAEGRLAELYAEQARIEEETAARLELVDRLRAQVQELEREKRDVFRRYNEQTATFDAERQSFYDNEQHLKSRIQSLIQARKAQAQTVLTTTQDDDHVQSDAEDQAVPELRAAEAKPIQVIEDEEENEPAEMTALRLELSTLSTSYSSLQTTVQHLSSQLLDLKRVNNQLQEENESYNILLREKTLNGQFDILRTVGTRDSDDDDDMAEDVVEKTDRGSLRSLERTPLDPVDEAVEDMDSTLLNDDQSIEDKTTQSSRPRERNRRQGRGRRADSSHSPTSKGESLADLPITGPGLDLAAELGRAENLAILEGRTQDVDDRDRSVTNGSTKTKRSKRVSTDKKLPESSSHGNISASGSTDVDALRNEVKSLKDANRALSLYASKIIDRIIAQEGFEHVLAVDYENNVQTKQKPATKTAQPKPAEEPPKKTRPQSAIVFPRSSPGSPPDPQQPNASPVIPSEPTATSKSQRRSLSFDWKSFSVFGGGGASTEKDKKDNNPNLRPLNLRPGAAVVGARKLDTQEDEDDRRERERMNAVLKLMGIEKPEQPISPIVTSPTPTGSGPSVFSSEPTSPKPQGSRFSFFRSRSTNSDNSNSNSANNSTPNMNLTQEALERAEAETSLAALDEREKILSAEISKGASGGFTELPRRSRGEEWRSKRSRKSGESGSGSTVWSAGMSTHREADSDNERTQDRNDA